MAIAPYDPSSLGPSQGAAIDQMAAQDQIQTTFDRGQLTRQTGISNIEEGMFAKPQLESSLGATGQYNSGAARMAEAHQHMGFENQRADLQSAFNRTQMDMKRNEVFAGIGLML